MADTPRIFGVPMRRHENGATFLLDNVVLCPGDDYWLWQVHFQGEVESAMVDTLDEAVIGIERAITRIREAARKLGT